MAAFDLFSGILETTETSGTGPHTLLGAVDSEHKTFASELSDGQGTFAFEVGDGQYQEGYVTYASGAITWVTIFRSSNGNAAVDWSGQARLIGTGLPGPGILDGANIERLHRAFGIKSYKNLLHNGGFQVAQRGDGPFTSATTFVNNDDSYLADGMLLLSDGNDIVDCSRVADSDFVSGWCWEFDVETANKKFGGFLPIEAAIAAAIKYRGKGSIQFKVKQNSGTSIGSIRAWGTSWSGTANAITSDIVSAWNGAGSDPTMVANWTIENAGGALSPNNTVAATISLKRAENIAFDTASLSNIGVFIAIDDVTTTVGDKIRIGDIQIEEGEKATEYEHRPVQVDQDLCKRYLRRLGSGLTGQWVGATQCEVGAAFDVEMRAAPTFISVSTSFSVIEIGVAGRTCTGTSGAAFAASGGRFSCTGATGATAGKFGITGQDNIALVSAEL